MSDDSSQPAKGQFEIERDGQLSYLAYATDGHEWISLLHTEVSPALRGHGIGSELARMALEYAKEKHLKVDVICPLVGHFINKHPQYKPLVRTQSRYDPEASNG